MNDIINGFDKIADIIYDAFNRFLGRGNTDVYSILLLVDYLKHKDTSSFEWKNVIDTFMHIMQYDNELCSNEVLKERIRYTMNVR